MPPPPSPRMMSGVFCPAAASLSLLGVELDEGRDDAGLRDSLRKVVPMPTERGGRPKQSKRQRREGVQVMWWSVLVTYSRAGGGCKSERPNIECGFQHKEYTLYAACMYDARRYV